MLFWKANAVHHHQLRFRADPVFRRPQPHDSIVRLGKETLGFPAQRLSLAPQEGNHTLSSSEYNVLQHMLSNKMFPSSSSSR